MDSLIGIKELYDVTIRLRQPMEIGNRKFSINEPILTFKTAEIAQIGDTKSRKKAIGGINNSLLVDWELDKEVSFAISHGILSPLSYALLSNSQLKNKKVKSVPLCEMVDVIEDEKCSYIDLRRPPNCLEERLGVQPNPNFESLPMGRRPELTLKPLPPSQSKWIFCYDVDTGRQIKMFSICGNRIIFPETMYRKVMVNYTCDCEDNIREVEVGNRLFNGFLKLDGKMNVKDEKSGKVTTAILELPKIKLSSSLSMRLGSGYSTSTVGDFYFTAYPEDELKKNSPLAKLSFLDTDLTGDYI